MKPTKSRNSITGTPRRSNNQTPVRRKSVLQMKLNNFDDKATPVSAATPVQKQIIRTKSVTLNVVQQSNKSQNEKAAYQSQMDCKAATSGSQWGASGDLQSKSSPVMNNSNQRKTMTSSQKRVLAEKGFRELNKVESMERMEVHSTMREIEPPVQQQNTCGQTNSWFDWFLCGATCGTTNNYPSNTEEPIRMSASDRKKASQRIADAKSISDDSFVHIEVYSQNKNQNPRLQQRATMEELDRILFNEQPPSGIVRKGQHQSSDEEELVYPISALKDKTQQKKNEDDLNATQNTISNNNRNACQDEQNDLNISNETPLLYPDRMEPIEQMREISLKQNIVLSGNNQKDSSNEKQSHHIDACQVKDTQETTNSQLQNVKELDRDSSDESIPEEIDDDIVSNTCQPQADASKPKQVMTVTENEVQVLQNDNKTILHNNLVVEEKQNQANEEIKADIHHQQQRSYLSPVNAEVSQSGFIANELTPSNDDDSSAMRFIKLEQHVKQNGAGASHLQNSGKQPLNSSLDTQEVVVVSSLEHLNNRASRQQKSEEQLSKEKVAELEEFERLEAELMCQQNEENQQRHAMSDKTTPADPTGGPKLTSNVKRHSMLEENEPDKLLKEQLGEITPKNQVRNSYRLHQFDMLNRSQNELKFDDSDMRKNEEVDNISFERHRRSQHTPNDLHLRAAGVYNPDSQDSGLINIQTGTGNLIQSDLQQNKITIAEQYVDQSIESIEKQENQPEIKAQVEHKESYIRHQKSASQPFQMNDQKVTAQTAVRAQAGQKNRLSLVDRQTKTASNQGKYTTQKTLTYQKYQKNSQAGVGKRPVATSRNNQSSSRNGTQNLTVQSRTRQQRRNSKLSSDKKTPAATITHAEGYQSIDGAQKSNLKSTKSNSAEKMQSQQYMPKAPGLSQSQSVRFSGPAKEIMKDNNVGSSRQNANQIASRYGKRAQIDLSSGQRQNRNSIKKQLSATKPAEVDFNNTNNTESSMSGVLKELAKSMRSDSINSADRNIRKSSSIRKSTNQQYSTVQDQLRPQITRTNIDHQKAAALDNSKSNLFPSEETLKKTNTDICSDTSQSATNPSYHTNGRRKGESKRRISGQSNQMVTDDRARYEQSYQSLRQSQKVQSSKNTDTNMQPTDNDICSESSRFVSSSMRNYPQISVSELTARNQDVNRESSVRDSQKELPFPSVQKDRDATQIALQNAPYPRLNRVESNRKSQTKNSSETSRQTAAFGSARQTSAFQQSASYGNSSLNVTPVLDPPSQHYPGVQIDNSAIQDKLAVNEQTKNSYRSARHQSLLQTRKTLKEQQEELIKNQNQMQIPDKETIDAIRSSSIQRRNQRNALLAQQKEQKAAQFARLSTSRSKKDKETSPARSLTRRTKVTGYFSGQGSGRRSISNDPGQTHQQTGGPMFAKKSVPLKVEAQNRSVSPRVFTGRSRSPIEKSLNGPIPRTSMRRATSAIRERNGQITQSPNSRIYNRLQTSPDRSRSPFQEKRLSRQSTSNIQNRQRTISNVSRNSQVRSPLGTRHQGSQIRNSTIKRIVTSQGARNYQAATSRNQRLVQPATARVTTRTWQTTSNTGSTRPSAVKKETTTTTTVTTTKNGMKTSRVTTTQNVIPEETKTQRMKAYASTRQLRTTTKLQAQSGTQAQKTTATKAVVTRPSKTNVAATSRIDTGLGAARKSRNNNQQQLSQTQSATNFATSSSRRNALATYASEQRLQ